MEIHVSEGLNVFTLLSIVLDIILMFILLLFLFILSVDLTSLLGLQKELNAFFLLFRL